MLTFDPPDLREKIIAAIESLSDVVEVEWEVVSSDDFDPAKFDDEIVSKDTVILSVAKLIDVKSAIPEQDRWGDQENSPRRA